MVCNAVKCLWLSLPKMGSVQQEKEEVELIVCAFVISRNQLLD